MLKINKVYTGTGDDGITCLIGGRRVSKAHPQIKVCGELDELNAFIGLLRTKAKHCDKYSAVCELLFKIQQDLFNIGEEIAGGSNSVQLTCASYNLSVKDLEKQCDYYNLELEELTSFVLPGAGELSSLCYLVKTVARRAERNLVSLTDAAAVKEQFYLPRKELLSYMNRLNDLFFILSRWFSREEAEKEELWVVTPHVKLDS